MGLVAVEPLDDEHDDQGRDDEDVVAFEGPEERPGAEEAADVIDCKSD